MLRILLVVSRLVFLVSRRYRSAQIVFVIRALRLYFLVRQLGVEPYFLLDRLNTPLVLLTLWFLPLIVLRTRRSPQFIVRVVSLTVCLLVAFSARSAIVFYIFFEARLIPTLYLILKWGRQPERVAAGLYLMLYTVSIRLPLLAALALIWNGQHHLCFLALRWRAPVGIDLLWVMVMLAFLAKIPIYGLHLWLPKAHVEAPLAGSMILAGVLMKLGGYGMMRMIRVFPDFHAPTIVPVLAVGGAAIAGFTALQQRDMKALIAYSSVSHMGLVIAGIVRATDKGWAGAIDMMVAHGLVSSALFVLAGLTYTVTKRRRLLVSKGLLATAPTLSMFWFIALAFNMGAPITLNFLAEALLIAGTVVQWPLLLIPIAINLFLTAAYSLKLYRRVNHGSPSEALNAHHPLTMRRMLLLSAHLVPIIPLFFRQV